MWGKDGIYKSIEFINLEKSMSLLIPELVDRFGKKADWRGWRRRGERHCVCVYFMGNVFMTVQQKHRKGLTIYGKLYSTGGDRNAPCQ